MLLFEKGILIFVWPCEKRCYHCLLEPMVLCKLMFDPNNEDEFWNICRTTCCFQKCVAKVMRSIGAGCGQCLTSQCITACNNNRENHKNAPFLRTVNCLIICTLQSCFHSFRPQTWWYGTFPTTFLCIQRQWKHFSNIIPTQNFRKVTDQHCNHCSRNMLLLNKSQSPVNVFCRQFL